MCIASSTLKRIWKRSKRYKYRRFASWSSNEYGIQNWILNPDGTYYKNWKRPNIRGGEPDEGGSGGMLDLACSFGEVAMEMIVQNPADRERQSESFDFGEDTQLLFGIMGEFGERLQCHLNGE